MRKAIDIEALVRWAFRDELPKEPVPTSFLSTRWSSPTEHLGIQHGVGGVDVEVPDRRNKFGLVPDRMAHDARPHPDAVTVYNSALLLGSLDVDLPHDWNPLADLGELGPHGAAAVMRALNRIFVTDRSGKRHRRESPVALVCRYAVMGVPDLRAHRPTLRYVTEYGKPKWFIREMIPTVKGSVDVEIDGFDRTARRPKKGAYRKSYLDPDPSDVAVTRGEYQIWLECLRVLASDLKGRLRDFDPASSRRLLEPWLSDGGQAGRVLADLRSGVA